MKQPSGDDVVALVKSRIGRPLSRGEMLRFMTHVRRRVEAEAGSDGDRASAARRVFDSLHHESVEMLESAMRAEGNGVRR